MVTAYWQNGQMNETTCPTCGGDGHLHEPKEMRELRGSLTQAVFAKLCGWSTSYQCDMELGRRRITGKNWDRAIRVTS